MKTIDSHVHLSHGRFDNTFRHMSYDLSSCTFSIEQGDRDSLLKAMKQQGIVAAIEPGINLASNQLLLDHVERQPGWLFPAVGLHPTRTPNEKWKDRTILKELTKRTEVIAVGETGLDFHYPRNEQHRACQVKWFIFQILLAHRRRLPLILHIRQADRVAIPILRLFKPFLHGGVAHCFYGDVRTAQAFIQLGFHLGIGGTLLQDNEAGETLRETVRQIPLEHLLLETDAPYVHPSCDVITSGKMRSKVRNTSLILPAIAGKIAELKNIDIETVEHQTTQNTIETFHLRLSQDMADTVKETMRRQLK